MISFFQHFSQKVYAVLHSKTLVQDDLTKLTWLFGGANLVDGQHILGTYIGPRVEMITPWSTNAVEITQNMGIAGIQRIEELIPFIQEDQIDPMLQAVYQNPDQDIFTINRVPEALIEIDDIAAYNTQEGLALNEEEIDYLNDVSKQLGRKLTDSEVFGFSQVNSEHCRHKIFNGTFIIDGEEKQESLFALIKKTSKQNPGRLVSAYKDNVAFIKGPEIEQFAPATAHQPDYFVAKPITSILSLKAETHNFPTTVEPFNGAATGSGGEIRDRMAGGQGSIPLAGTAVYMTSYPRLSESQTWASTIQARKWLYQTPADILIKASDGASDYGNKFGQPLICGSLLTFEHSENEETLGFDKVIMLAGGIGYGKASDAQKKPVSKGDKIVILGGDNYRIGMGGGAVSSVATGQYANKIELNAVQRSNPEMQKRVANAIRAFAEMDGNEIISIHDHGAGGHLNCLSELVEDSGGVIEIDKLPLGDPTLSEKEIIGNESQERMGLILHEKSIDLLQKIAERERAPMYVVGKATGDQHFTFKSKSGHHPIDWNLKYMFGSSPTTILKDESRSKIFQSLSYDSEFIERYLEKVLQLEAVACKDWLTNKVDRCVTGKVAKQQTVGPLQLPLNNVAVMALDWSHNKGIATSIGHAPTVAIVDPAAGSRVAIAEALTNIIWAPIADGLAGVSLSANWMWPAKTEGEDARLYKAVEAVSEFAIGLGINIPTGKDSLSMTQRYPNGEQVSAPGTVIISAIGEVSDIRKVVEPVVQPTADSLLYLIPLTKNAAGLGGTALSQAENFLGGHVADVDDAVYFKSVFNTIQESISNNEIISGHDVSGGGLITALLEMNFPNTKGGMEIDLSGIPEDIVLTLFNENPALVVQAGQAFSQKLNNKDLLFYEIGKPAENRILEIRKDDIHLQLDIDHYRDVWFKCSHWLDQKQTETRLADERFAQYKHLPLQYTFPKSWTGNLTDLGLTFRRTQSTGLKAAIIREKGVNSDREMAYMLYLAGFDVKDVHMTDLISGREDLSDISMIVFVGGFSNSDVLGSAKGWAGAFKYNEKAKTALDNFYNRPDTLSLGVCNGCQLMMELGLIFPNMGDNHPKMLHNESGKFECIFTSVDIPANKTVMLESLAGTTLGIWAAHGEGKFHFPMPIEASTVVGRYHYNQYPANPNGSPDGVAMLASKDGRHLAMMPHLERSMFPWNWPYYPGERKTDEITPWIEAFVNARKWVENNR